MPLRLLEITTGKTDAEYVSEILHDNHILDSWRYNSSEGRVVFKLLVNGEDTDGILSELNDRIGGSDVYRVVLLPVDATLPNGSERPHDTKESFFTRGSHLSIEELYSDISDKSQLTVVYTALAVLSTLVAAFGILKGSTVMIIGAMVIAPLLGPNMAMSLGTTLGDFGFIRKSLVTSLFYFLAVFAVSVAIGFALKPGAGIGGVLEYSTANLGDVVLSLVAGAAGALALTIGLSTMLIGVTVALAVLPSLSTMGMMLGADHPGVAYGALLLFLTNVICINLAGVLTFLIQGIHPIKWWEAEKAKRATVGAVILWLGFLAALVLLIRAQRFS